MNEAPLNINDFPQFSPWPARLLGIEPWQQRYKTPEELTREYERDKWGPLLKRVQQAAHPVSVEDVDDWLLGDTPPCLSSIGDDLVVTTELEAHHRHLELLAEILQRQLPASALVELGCGYGPLILKLARRTPFQNMRLMAADYTVSAQHLVESLAASQGTNIAVGHCDLSLPHVTDLDIPAGALIYTSFAATCVPRLTASFVESLASFRPRALVHLEACGEHGDSHTLLGLMRRRYIEVNDYNRNMETLLHEQQKLGALEILEERPNVLGANPLLAASVFVWRPRR